MAIPLAVALTFAVVTRPQFESAARFLVLPSRDYSTRSMLGAALSTIALDSSQIVSAEVELMGNRSLLLAVLESEGVAAIYPDLGPADRDAAILRLQHDLLIEPVFAASVIRLRFRNPDPARAAETLGNLIRTYFERRPAILRDDASSAVAKQGDDMAARLEDAENRLQTFATTNGIADLADQQERLLRREADLQDNEHEARAIATARSAELAAVMAQLAATPRDVRAASSDSRSRDLESAKSSLLTLELRRRDLVSRTADSSRDVANVDLQIATIRSFIAAEPPRQQSAVREARNPAIGELERRNASLAADLAGNQARIATVTQQLATIGAQRAELNAISAEYERLAGVERNVMETYRQYVPRAEEARIDEMLARGRPPNVRVIENPTPPEVVRGVRTMIIVAGILGSVIAALAVTFIRSSLRQTFVVPAEAERSLPWPLLMTVDQR